MTERLKTQRVPQKWVLRVVVTDTPGPGEDYLDSATITANVLHAAASLKADGLEMDIGSCELMHRFNPSGTLPKGDR